MIEMMSADDEREIRTSLRKVLSKFPDEYWMQHDMDHEFPWDFHQAMAEAGWLGICIPEKYGGGGAGVQEAALLLEEVTGSGGALNAGTTVQVALFGLEPIVKYGTRRAARAFPASGGRGQSAGVLRRHRAGRRHRHHQHHHLRREGARRLPGQRPEDLHLAGRAGRAPAADHPHRAAFGRRRRRPTA